MPGTLGKLDEMQQIQWTKMSIEQRKEMLLQQLDLSGLEGWSGANCASAHALLTEYHNIFLLEPGDFGFSHGGGSESPHEGDVGSRCYLLYPKSMM